MRFPPVSWATGLEFFLVFLIRAIRVIGGSSENLVFTCEIRESLYREAADYADDTDSTEHMRA
ncbi:MAG: hypothetical protein DME48_03970 [Verrucomicrobia bacterium]|nr:MAG: hypothetical protein DME48_03970 [Verrucomicrobiota bacterium]